VKYFLQNFIFPPSIAPNQVRFQEQFSGIKVEVSEDKIEL